MIVMFLLGPVLYKKTMCTSHLLLVDVKILEILCHHKVVSSLCMVELHIFV